MPSLAEQLVTRGDLDDRAHVSTRANRQYHLTDRYPEQLAVAIFEANAIVRGVRLPKLKLDDQIQALAFTNRGYAEQIFDVEDPKATDLDVVAEQRGRLTKDHARRAIVTLDYVVRHQAMTTHHELERAFAFADAALAEQEHPDLEHVHQHAVDA